MSYLDSKVSIRRTVNVTLSLDASYWQLFTEEEGVEGAAKAINAGVADAINSSQNWDEAYDKATEVLGRFANFGARDTEPRGVLKDILDLAFPRLA